VTVKVALVDYGVGNLHSLVKALEGAGAATRISADWDEILESDAVVLPGVGAFSAAVEALPADRERVRNALAEGLPCLGICLGMQILFDTSSEGEGVGIGLIPGTVEAMKASILPQMGWNDVVTAPDPLFEDVGPLVAYYANSYVCRPEDEGVVIGWTSYADDRFAGAVRVGRTRGVQFHPEKSSHAGRRVIENFVRRVARGDRAEVP
jgi:glutamine amidotransferase